MKEEIGATIKYSLLALLAAALLVGGTLALNRVFYPWWLSIQRTSVEESKSFTDANNNMLQTYILEHSRLDSKIVEAEGNPEVIAVYQAQQQAIIEKMCVQISTMRPGTVNPNTLSWLNSKGGCR